MLVVCPLSHVAAQVAARGPSHLTTLLSPPETLATPAGIAAEGVPFDPAARH